MSNRDAQNISMDRLICDMLKKFVPIYNHTIVSPSALAHVISNLVLRQYSQSMAIDGVMG